MKKIERTAIDKEPRDGERLEACGACGLLRYQSELAPRPVDGLRVCIDDGKGCGLQLVEKSTRKRKNRLRIRR